MFFGIWLKGGVPKAGLAPQAGLQEVMKARSCQQEAEAAHPAPARGRWKRNAAVVIVVVVRRSVFCFSTHAQRQVQVKGSRGVLGQGKRQTASL